MSGHVHEMAITFCFEVLTNAAFVPALLVMHRYRRHFELYIGVFQLATGMLCASSASGDF